MTLPRPTLATIIDRVQSDIEANLPGADARLRRTPERALALATAGASHGLHGHIAYLGSQIIFDTAESVFLRRWAAAFGVTPKDPAAANGTITVTGTPATSVPLGTTWERSDGVQFVSTSAVVLPGGGSESVPVEAVDAGIDPNTDESTTVSLTSPIAGVDTDATVESPGLRNGTDAETDASLLARLLLRAQTPSAGGGPGEYVIWALEQPAVTRAWEYPQALGAGTVLVRYMTDGATADGIPSPSSVTAMQAHLEAKAPLTATVTALAPIASPMNPSIALTPDTAAVRATVEAELDDLVLRRSAPGGTVLLSQIDESISRAAGEEDHTLVSPTADVVEATGYITTLGTITWV